MISKLKQWIHGPAFPHALVLAICLFLMGLPALLSPARPLAWHQSKTSTEQIKLGGIPLPESCIMKKATGLPCPGCGLTRSWVSLCHGRFKESMQHNRMGLLVFFYTFLQATRHLAWLSLPGFQPTINRTGRILDYAIIGLLATLVINWAFMLFNF